MQEATKSANFLIGLSLFELVERRFPLQYLLILDFSHV